MPLTPEQIDPLVTATAAALGLHLAAEHKPGVLRYFALASEMADLVQGLPLKPDDESGSVFTPVAPELEE